jgi:hypothetical protein
MPYSVTVNSAICIPGGIFAGKYTVMQNEDDSIEAHQQIIDQRIKEGIDKLLTIGDITDEDFYINADGIK